MEEIRPRSIGIDEDTAGQSLSAESGTDEATQAIEDRSRRVQEDPFRGIPGFDTVSFSRAPSGYASRKGQSGIEGRGLERLQAEEAVEIAAD